MDDTQPPEEHPEDQPEEDGLLSDPKHIRRDLQLMAQFPVEVAARSDIVNKVEGLICDTTENDKGETVPLHRPRIVVSAVNAMTALMRANTDWERLVMERERLSLLAESGSSPTKTVIQIAAEQAIAMDLTILPPGVAPPSNGKHSGNGKHNGNGKKP
jgi:hypothetical protein